MIAEKSARAAVKQHLTSLLFAGSDRIPQFFMLFKNIY